MYLEVADVEVVVEDDHVRRLLNELGAFQGPDGHSRQRVDDEDFGADGVDDDDLVVNGRSQSGHNVDALDANDADEEAAVVEDLKRKNIKVI